MWALGLVVGGWIGAFGGNRSIVLGAIAGMFIALLWSRTRKLGERVKVLEAQALSSVPTVTTHAIVPEASDLLQVEQPVMPPALDVAAQSAAEPAPEFPPPPLSQPMSVPAAPEAPRAPSALWSFFFGGNTLVRVGILVLFIGVSFLLKYAADHGFVPIELRLAGVAAGGIALLVLGWRLRAQRAGYALMLQGGGIGILYLTVFAALKMYALVPPTLAFILLAGMAFFSALLAIVQDSKALAITGAAGGFLAPVLASSGGGNHVALFGFYVVLNSGILFIALHKAWRELNLVGFAFTALIGLAWGARSYDAEKFATTEPFLIVFFLMYVAIAVLFALRQAPRLTHYVDGTIVFGVPLVAFGMQAVMMKGIEFGAAFSALALAAFYLTLAMLLHRKQREPVRLLVESFLALGVGFATLAVPLALDARWTSAVWAVEGAAIFWVGVRQHRWLARAFGMVLQLAAGMAFLSKFHNLPAPENLLPILNSSYLGCVMVSVAALFINAYASRRREVVGDNEMLAARGLFVWGVAWWLGGGIFEIERHLSQVFEWNAELIYFAGSCAVFATLWRRLAWSEARFASLLMLPLAIFTLALMAAEGVNHPFAYHCYAGWLLVFAVHALVLRMHAGHADEHAPWLQYWHAAGFWLLTVVLSWEVAWQFDDYVDGRRVWPLVAWAIVPGALIALFAARGSSLGWPVAAHRYAYLYLGALPIAVFLLGWIVVANLISSGDPAPLPYVPLVNPLDLAQFGALLAIVVWYLHLKRADIAAVKLPGAATAWKILGVVMLIALNGVLLRTLHHYADVPFRWGSMMNSTLVQAAFSLFWSLLALSAMFFANKRGLRALWFVGAVLLAVVIAKLALVDLSNTGTVARIVSFIGVGLFCVVIGYFAPVPPAARPEADSGGVK